MLLLFTVFCLLLCYCSVIICYCFLFSVLFAGRVGLEVVDFRPIPVSTRPRGALGRPREVQALLLALQAVATVWRASSVCVSLAQNQWPGYESREPLLLGQLLPENLHQYLPDYLLK